MPEPSHGWVLWHSSGRWRFFSSRLWSFNRKTSHHLKLRAGWSSCLPYACLLVYRKDTHTESLMLQSNGKQRHCRSVELSRKRRKGWATQEVPFPWSRQLNTSFMFLFKGFIVVHAQIKTMFRARKLLGHVLIFKCLLRYIGQNFTASYTLSTNSSNDAFLWSFYSAFISCMPKRAH